VSEAIVTVEHCRALGYCARGMRAFFAQHGLDWQAFRAAGLPASTIEATGDAMAQRVAALARETQKGSA
jgi:hypothetical protein